MTTFESERPPDYLARLASSDVGRAYKSLVVDEMRVDHGHTVLDLGCGPGSDLPAFAAATGADGRTLGIDLDADAVAEASVRSKDLTGVSLAVGDVHRLPLPDNSVDRAHTDRVLQHVAHPAAVVGEAARVLRPHGVAGFAEPDWDTLVIDCPDPSVADAYRHFVTDRVVRNARIGRRLPAVCEQEGLRTTGVLPVTAVYRDASEADRVLGLRRVTERAVAAGYLSAPVARAWLRHLGTGPFLASVTLFVTLADKPG